MSFWRRFWSIVDPVGERNREFDNMMSGTAKLGGARPERVDYSLILAPLSTEELASWKLHRSGVIRASVMVVEPWKFSADSVPSLIALEPWRVEIVEVKPFIQAPGNEGQLFHVHFRFHLDPQPMLGP
jgi:hypothetical protein